MLVPAGIMIVIALGSLAVNASLLFMAERGAANTASAIANDVAALGLDVDHFRSTGEYRLVDDLTAIAAHRTAIAQAQGASGLVPGTLNISIARSSPDSVTVIVTAEVKLLIRPPLGEPTQTVQASAVGTARPDGP